MAQGGQSGSRSSSSYPTISRLFYYHISPVRENPDKHILKKLGFTCGERLGNGSYGTVFRGVCNTDATKRYPITRLEALRRPKGLVTERTEKGINYFVEKSLAGKPCAIKVMDTEDVSDTIFNEILTCVSISHQNCVELYAVVSDRDRGLYYIVMEFLNGKDLSEVMMEHDSLTRPMDGHMAIEMILQLGNGLQYLHSQSIYHGDLHAANVMYCISPAGYVWKYLDFGLSGKNESTKLMQDIFDLARIYGWIIDLAQLKDELAQDLLRIKDDMNLSQFHSIKDVMAAINSVIKKWR